MTPLNIILSVLEITCLAAICGYAVRHVIMPALRALGNDIQRRWAMVHDRINALNKEQHAQAQTEKEARAWIDRLTHAQTRMAQEHDMRRMHDQEQHKRLNDLLKTRYARQQSTLAHTAAQEKALLDITNQARQALLKRYTDSAQALAFQQQEWQTLLKTVDKDPQAVS